MHELPKDLTSSLRSYRGSVYGGSRKDAEQEDAENIDLEKGLGRYRTQAGATESSLIIHPTKSNQAVSQSREEQGPRENGESSRQDQLLRFEEHRRSMRPQVDTQVAPAKSHATAQTPGKQSVLHAPPVKDLDPAADRLAEDLTPLSEEDFYGLMGMRHPSEAGNESVKTLAVPHGLFSKMVRSMLYTHRKYRVFAIAVYVFLILQLMISAIFIVLGALRQVDTHTTIAILGAVSTVIAGGLALMQGQGLPNRLRMSRDSLRSVIFEAEELYWDMRSGRTILYKDVKKVREDYLRVLEEQKRNHPDAWNSVTSGMAQGPAKAKEGGVPGGNAAVKKG